MRRAVIAALDSATARASLRGVVGDGHTVDAVTLPTKKKDGTIERLFG